MSRLLLLFITLGLLLGGWFLIRFATDSHKVLPLDQADMETVETPFESWREYSSPTGVFQVLLPAFPQRAKETVRDSNSGEVRLYDMYVAEQQNGTIFMISLIGFPGSGEENGSAHDFLARMMKDMVASNPSNELLEVSPAPYKGFEALAFSVSNPELRVDTQAFVVNKELYVLSMLASPANYRHEDYLFFINSFEVASDAVFDSQGEGGGQ